MGATIHPDAVVAVSTGAVAFNDAYQEPRSFDPGEPTGAVPFNGAGLGTTVAEHLDAPLVINHDGPGPVSAEQWPGKQAGAKMPIGPDSEPDDEPTPARPARKAPAKKAPAKKAAAKSPRSSGASKPQTKVVEAPKKAAPKKTGGARTKGK